MFELGEEKQGYVNILTAKLLSWLQSSDENLHIAKNYVPSLVKSILFGPIHSRGKRFTFEVLQFVYNLGDELSVNQLRKK